jgi:hypothetical protein
MDDLNLALQCAQALPHWLWLLLAPVASGVAAHLDAIIKQPAAGSLWLLIRKPLSVLAGNYGWAKNADQETLAEWWAANSQAFINWLVSKMGDALKAEIAKRAAAAPAPEQVAEQPSAPPPQG